MRSELASEPRIRIRITAARERELRAEVEVTSPDCSHRKRFEVTLGSDIWQVLEKDLRQTILNRAAGFTTDLQREVDRAAALINRRSVPSGREGHE